MEKESKTLQDRALQVDAQAQYEFAMSLKKRSSRIPWFEKAVAQGQTDAMIELGTILLDGTSTCHDSKRGAVHNFEDSTIMARRCRIKANMQ